MEKSNYLALSKFLINSTWLIYSENQAPWRNWKNYYLLSAQEWGKELLTAQSHGTIPLISRPCHLAINKRRHEKMNNKELCNHSHNFLPSICCAHFGHHFIITKLNQKLSSTPRMHFNCVFYIQIYSVKLTSQYQPREEL